MSSREPLWYCHQCHAEMRPLMTPDPTCASCHGTFVEKLENLTDDPRDFQNRTPDTFDFHNDLPASLQGFLRSGSLANTDNFASGVSLRRSHSPPTQRTQDASSSTSAVHFELRTNAPNGSTTRTFILGSPSAFRRSPSDRSSPTMLEFLRRDPTQNGNNTRPNGDIAGQLVAQYLFALLGHEPRTPGDPFVDILGMPSSARWGDYVFNQEALDQILAQLAENSTGGRPIPATEEIIADLPREVLTEGSPLLEKDCAVCKESFKLNPEDPDDLVVATLPCKHPFHAGCILPWLKSSGTCPVCRFALIAQPQQNSPGGPPGGSSAPNRTDPPSGSRPQPSGNSDRGSASSFFHAIFGGGPGGHSDSSSARSRHNLDRTSRNTRPEVTPHNLPPFPGRWIEDID